MLISPSALVNLLTKEPFDEGARLKGLGLLQHSPETQEPAAEWWWALRLVLWSSSGKDEEALAPRLTMCMVQS